MVIGNRNGVEEHAIAHPAVDRAVRGRGGGDARDQAEPRAGEIRHAGGAVVDYRQPPAGQREVPQRRRAGMRRGKYVDARAPVDLGKPCPVCRIVERRGVETPAGEGGGVAVHDADAQSADLRDAMHRQGGQALPHAGRCDCPQLGHDVVRALHDASSTDSG